MHFFFLTFAWFAWQTSLISPHTKRKFSRKEEIKNTRISICLKPFAAILNCLNLLHVECHHSAHTLLKLEIYRNLCT